MHTRSVLHSLALLALAVLISGEADARSARLQRAGFDPGRDPEKDLRSAVAQARKTGKRILLDVGGEWCIWCHRLDRCIKENRDIESMLDRRYIVVKVNYSSENKNEKILSRFPRIPGYPHLFVLGSDGTLLHSEDTSLLESGDHHDAQKVLSFLKSWSGQSPHD